MKFSELPPEKQYEAYQAFRKGEINSPEDLNKFYPKEAPKGLQTIDTGLSNAASFVNQGIEKVKENPILANRIQRWGDLMKLGGLPAQAVGAGANAVMNAFSIPKGPELSDALPKTSQATGINPNARDLLPLVALEGLGRGGSLLKGYGERGMVNALEKGKPVMPPLADKAMVADILDKNYLPHHEAASDLISENALKLRERGVGGSEAAKSISDSSPISISPARIEQLHEFFPEHPVVRDLKGRLDAARAGTITNDFVQEKPGYTQQEKILTPSETIQSTPQQGDLFDKNYYANPDAYSKPMSDFTAHNERGLFPTQPTIQKPIEPELQGSATKIPADYQFKETQVPPEGHYDFQPDSLYDIFSYANKNRHKAWQRDPITGQPIAKNAEFGSMMSGLRSDLRSIKTPLSEDQINRVKAFNPEFEGATVGDAVTHLNQDTYNTIKNQKMLTKTGVEAGPLGFMESMYSNPDKIAFAQKMGRDYDMGSLLDYANKYGASKDYAKDLSSYMEKGVKGTSFNPDKFAKHAMYGGVPMALANEAGKLVGSPVMRYNAAMAAGSVLQKVRPTNLLNMGETE